MNKICQLLNIQFPIIQAGMVWCSGWRLASAVSNYGGLGTIGAGSMHPETLEEHIVKLTSSCNKPFAVNLPLLYPQIDELIKIIIAHKVPVVISSAGNPATWTPLLKSHGIKVLHVVSSAKFAAKAEAAGVDAVIAEGFEAGGHNGREETTTFCLIPLVKQAVSCPVVAAGGIATGKSMLAARVLGADAVQIGSRFVASEESSAHVNFKRSIIGLAEGQTKLTLKELAPVRLIKNHFFQEIETAYHNGADKNTLSAILGKGRAKKGMFEGDLDEGELEIGQVSSQIHQILPVYKIMDEILTDYKQTLALTHLKQFEINP